MPNRSENLAPFDCRPREEIARLLAAAYLRLIRSRYRERQGLAAMASQGISHSRAELTGYDPPPDACMDNHNTLP
jgi:hypothetical protein